MPLAGAVLVAVNTRLAPAEVRYICEHSGARMLFVDVEYAASVIPAVADLVGVELIVRISDHNAPAEAPEVPGVVTYDEFLARGSDEPLPWRVDDENSTIAINYTSGHHGPPEGRRCTPTAAPT